MIKITERTVYEPLTRYLEQILNASAISEVRIGESCLDIFFKLDSSPFIMEVKLGEEERKLTKAIAQVFDYAFEYGTKNVIILVFTDIKSGQLVLDIEKFKQQLFSQKVKGWVHTDYLDVWIENKTIIDVFKEIKIAFERKIRKIDFNSIVKAIREIVQDLYEVIRQSKTEEIFEEVATKLELFTTLGEIKDEQKAKAQVSMLASYLLFNQLLFYQVYKIKTNDSRIPELKPIKDLKELENYFDKIKNEIDYQPIYDIKLIDKIPNREEILNILNVAIKNLLLLRTEHITQDLAGRFFHALLPKEVAKVWAAFYTNPVAAEILANLAIDRWDETVLDPACGSGTLLSTAYRRKLELYKEQSKKVLDEETEKKLHKQFVENDITGIDIMPFAAHLTTINLSLQKLEQPTNVVRIARMDSLASAPKILTEEFKQKGILLRSFTEEAQLTLTGAKKIIRKSETISPAGRGREFYLKPVDVIIMNPPFSDREKLPKYYLEQLNKSPLGKICGHQINLWGYFLALADLMLKPNGKIAAVLPINIARGKATEKIRNYLLENYHIKYIIKSTRDFAFSESAAFKDILLIAEKKIPKKDDNTVVMFLKQSIKELKEEDIKKIIQLDSNFVEYEILKHSKLIEHKDNLMPFLYSFSLKRAKNINDFLTICFNKDINLFRKLREDEIKFPHSFRPTGASEVLTITRKIDISRSKRALLLMLMENKNYIEAEVKNTKIKLKIPKTKLQFLLRTITGIGKFNLSQEIMDYLIIEKYEGFEKIVRLSKQPHLKWDKKIEETIKGNLKTLTNCCIPDKINLVSPNTKLIGFYSDIEFVPGSTICSFLSKNNEFAKVLTLYFNSIISIAQILQYKSETQGTYSRMTVEDWLQFKLLDVSNLSKSKKMILLNLFNKLKDIEFPSIIEQLEKRFWARVELDKTILKILGFSDQEIEEWLPKVYDAVLEELKSLKEVR